MNNSMMEDRKNDWLARQLFEEKLAERRMISMFDLRYSARREHEEHCDAKELRQSHRKKCNAGAVDTARGK